MRVVLRCVHGLCFAGLMLMGMLLNAAVNAGQRKRLIGEGID